MSKGLDALKEIKSEPFSWEKLKDSLDIIEKELKALEIIKDRLIVEDKGKYIKVVCEFSIPSKYKNYDLLKEVLL